MQLSHILILTTLLANSLLAQDAIRDFWFNGAEINSYELSQARYGEQHPGHAEFIFVTEPFRPDEQVKNESDNGPSTDVLKLNALRTFNTGIYSYRTMTSTFRPIDLENYPHALKSNTSVQDWCGQAFQQINRSKHGWRVHLYSYFDQAGDQDFTLLDTWLEDELWVLARLDPNQLPIGTFNSVPGAVTLRFEHQDIAPSKATGTLTTKGKLSTYRLHYPHLKRELLIHFDTDFPHIIRAWEETTPQGTTTAKLTHRIMNSTYWSEHQPSDRTKRKQLGLQPIAD